MARVVLAMSGGVDSSVAAWLLREQGHEVVGVFMRHGAAAEAACVNPAPSGHQGCCSAADAADARRVADQLGVPFYAIDFAADFGRIIDYFVAEYALGRTPNPCIQCNNWLKFGRLVEYANAIGAELIATGHYARIAADPATGQAALWRGLDEQKDQSYVLFGIARALLARLLLPVGNYHKAQIRQMAQSAGLGVAGKPDSQEICFLPERDHAALVRRRIDADRSGEIVTTTGRLVGRHAGIEGFTVGQRKGLGVAFGEPHYVVRIEPDTRRVVVGRREELARTELTAGGAHWLVDNVGNEFCGEVKIRYRSRALAARVELLAADRFRVCFDEPAFGVAPGQAAVCYQGERVLGGGWIE